MKKPRSGKGSGASRGSKDKSKTTTEPPQPGDAPVPGFRVPRGYGGKPTQPGQRVLYYRAPDDSDDSAI